MENNKENNSELNNKQNATKTCIRAKLKIFTLIIIYMLIKYINNKPFPNKNNFEYIKKRERMYDLKTKKYAIVHRLECPQCGFFSFYIVHLGCLYKYLTLGYIF